MAMRLACCGCISVLVIGSIAVESASPPKATEVTIRDGYLQKADGSLGEFVGNSTSALQSKVVDGMFEAVNSSSWSSVSVINSTLIRSLNLHGSYDGDAQLQLPSLFRLRLNGSIKVKPGASSSDRFAALVVLQDVSYTAVIGGKYDASGGGGFGAVSLLSCVRCAVYNIQGLSDSHIISVNKGVNNEIARSTIGPGAGRCIWTLATSRALVHSNRIHACASHSLDFDAYTKNSIAYNNTCTENGKEGIFVEETASDNVIVGNTIVHSTRSGIGVYANAVGPVKGNIFIGNTVSGNEGAGITVGGYGHDPKKQSENNVFVDNTISGNGVGANIHHGATQGDFWTGNVNSDNWFGDPQDSSSVAVFDPLVDIPQASSTLDLKLPVLV